MKESEWGRVKEDQGQAKLTLEKRKDISVLLLVRLLAWPVRDVQPFFRCFWAFLGHWTWRWKEHLLAMIIFKNLFSSKMTLRIQIDGDGGWIVFVFLLRCSSCYPKLSGWRIWDNCVLSQQTLQQIFEDLINEAKLIFEFYVCLRKSIFLRAVSLNLSAASPCPKYVYICNVHLRFSISLPQCKK